MKKKFCLLLVLAVLGLAGSSENHSVYINEMMSSNSNFLFDEDGDDSDWIELYNSSPHPVNLSGYYISDKADQLNRWAFPAEIIPPDSFLVIFASGKDRAEAGSELHTNFSIKDEGEALFLTFRGRVIHQLPAVALETNTSFGLFPDGHAELQIFDSPSPGAPNQENQASDDLNFSSAGGFYEDSFFLTLNCTSGNYQIRYTTDGSLPVPESALYNEPLFLDSLLWSTARIDTIRTCTYQYYFPPQMIIPRAIVVRGALFDSTGMVPGSVRTQTYFIRSTGVDHGDLPVISVCAGYEDLFNDTTGILVPGIHWNPDNPDWSGNYFQTGDEWERLIHYEYYDHDNAVLNQDAGIRIHGGSTRKYPQRGFRIYARAEYGDPEFNIRMFSNKNLTEFSRFVLKGFQASWSGAGIDEAVCQGIASGLACDYLGIKPAILYINGEYWGIYFIMERIDNHYLEDNFGVDKDSVDLIANWYGVADEGSNVDFLEMYNYIESHTFTDSLDYQYIDEHIDVVNFIDYQLFEIYNANYDWAANNMKCWRTRQPGSKWRWIFYDGDAAMHTVHDDGFERALSLSNQGWPTNAHSTLFLRKFIENPVFYRKFKERLEYLLNHTLTEELLQPHVDSNSGIVAMDVPKQSARFHYPLSPGLWSADIGEIYNFISQRVCIVSDQFSNRFDEALDVSECIIGVEDIKSPDFYCITEGNIITLVYTSVAPINTNVTIFNSAGRKVFSEFREVSPGENRIPINITSFTPGIYVLCFNDGTKILSLKIII